MACGGCSGSKTLFQARRLWQWQCTVAPVIYNNPRGLQAVCFISVSFCLLVCGPSLVKLQVGFSQVDCTGGQLEV